jgi:hypothetical protein
MMRVRIGTFNLENMFIRYRVLNGERAGPYNPNPIPFSSISEFIREYSHLIDKFGGAEVITTDLKVRERFYKELSKTPAGKRILAKFLLEGVTIENLPMHFL